MIDLHYWTTPNGHKITIFLEEAGLPYKIFPVNIGKGEQFKAEFLAISPNNRIPAILDHQPADGGKPISVFETGAILLYLADKTGRFIAKDLRGRTATIEWLFWQMGGLGPMAGQYNHFGNYAVEKLPYAIDRYRNEVNRLYGVMNKRLADRAFLAGDYSIADMALLSVGGAVGAPGAEHRRLPASQALAGDDRRARGGQARPCQGKGGQPEPGRHQHRRAARHPVRPDRAVDRAHGVAAIGFRNRRVDKAKRAHLFSCQHANIVEGAWARRVSRLCPP
jgi:glutathione S-transferase